MPKGQVSFTWKSDTLRPGTKAFPVRLDRAITAATEYTATHGEAAMKRNASWTDQTGNARNGLFGQAEHSPTLHRVIFGHAVPYGIWLEVRFAGRYAIILPTLKAEGQNIMRLLGKLIGGLK